MARKYPLEGCAQGKTGSKQGSKKYPLEGGAPKTEGPDSVQKIPPGGLHSQNMH